MNKYLLIILLAVFSISASAQEKVSNDVQVTNAKDSYIYVRVEDKLLTSKLIVKVDFGDSAKQIEEGKKLSEILYNKKSHAAIINNLSELGYELVNTVGLPGVGSSTNGTFVILYLLKKVN
ncbi:hypothetical protein J5U18_09165 [Sphingobacteriaceae bacterium WQ 2009]|uniref:Uncharacterized protein n=1 Tax=Rhinopithecimicrobium faecis TaxID=2820698 RepID=A0A8T4H9F2_9SPHI|nr:hypothetical protein [Sphingobacteriaceae bacterium WQ 2009]